MKANVSSPPLPPRSADKVGMQALSTCSSLPSSLGRKPCSRRCSLWQLDICLEVPKNKNVHFNFEKSIYQWCGFWYKGSGSFLTPGSGIRIQDGKYSRAKIRDEHRWSFWKLKKVFRVKKYLILWCGSRILSTLDKGSKKSEPGQAFRIHNTNK